MTAESWLGEPPHPPNIIAGTWKITRKKSSALLSISPFAPISAAHRAELETEGERLLRFAEEDAIDYAVEWADSDAS